MANLKRHGELYDLITDSVDPKLLNELLELEREFTLQEESEGYGIEQDHANIKKQIKGWEHSLDDLVSVLHTVHEESTLGDINEKAIPLVDQLAQEMMAINI